MLTACDYAVRMSMLQIRNVPPEIHRRLKARAAMEGQTLSDFALAELERSLERPTRRELIERVRARTSPSTSESAVDAVRAERETR